MKKCSKCEIEKDQIEFVKNSNTSDKLSPYCKECNKIYMSEYYLKNKNIIKNKQNERKDEKLSYNRKYRMENKEKLKDYNKTYREKNKEAIKEKRKINYDENREEILKYQREYKKKNPENKENIKKRIKKRIQSDYLFKLRIGISQLIRNSIKNNGHSKYKETLDILGCSIEELLFHLNDNPYGFKYGDPNLDIDHIIPLCRASNEIELIELNFYKNLQLLPSEYNRYIKKSNDWDAVDFERYLSSICS